MFSGILEKFQVMQDGITSSLRGLSVGEPVAGSAPIVLNAGCPTLFRYSNEWVEISKGSELNVNLVHNIEGQIQQMKKETQRLQTVWSALIGEVGALEELVRTCETVVNLIGKIRLDGADIEDDLARLENLIESEEHNRRKNDEKNKLNEYRSQRLDHFDGFRAKLAAHHSEQIRQKDQEELLKSGSKASNLDVS